MWTYSISRRERLIWVCQDEKTVLKVVTRRFVVAVFQDSTETASAFSTCRTPPFAFFLARMDTPLSSVRIAKDALATTSCSMVSKIKCHVIVGLTVFGTSITDVLVFLLD